MKEDKTRDKEREREIQNSVFYSKERVAQHFHCPKNILHDKKHPADRHIKYITFKATSIFKSKEAMFLLFQFYGVFLSGGRIAMCRYRKLK